MSPSPAAPRSASISACASTSPSEWPGEPARMLELDPAEHERDALLERVRVDADPDAELATAQATRRLLDPSQPRSAASQRLDPLEVGRPSSP